MKPNALLALLLSLVALSGCLGDDGGDETDHDHDGHDHDGHDDAMDDHMDGNETSGNETAQNATMNGTAAVEYAVNLAGVAAEVPTGSEVTFEGAVEAYTVDTEDWDGDGELDRFPADPGAFSWTLDFGAENATAASGTEADRNEDGLILVPFTYDADGAYTAVFNVTFADGTSLEDTLKVSTYTPIPPPDQTEFEFGPSLGCAGDYGTCVDRELGPVDALGLDGFWVELDERYWGYTITGTVSNVLGDSDGQFFNADLTELSDISNGGGPVAGTVPSGTAWLFVYSYGEPATAMTISFAPA